MSKEKTARQRSHKAAADADCSEPHAPATLPASDERTLSPVRKKIGEGDRNLAQRSEWFRGRTGRR